MANPMPKALFRFLVLALALAISLVFAELILRKFSPTYIRLHSPPHPFLKAHPTRGWAMIPGYRGRDWQVDFRVNALGFRGLEIAREKPPGVFRLLVLGDSIAMGVGLPDNLVLSARLESFSLGTILASGSRGSTPGRTISSLFLPALCLARSGPSQSARP